MKITDILAENRLTVSCEFFPPKKNEDLPHHRELVKEMASLKPSFMSVTYGAGGSREGLMLDIADEMENVNKVTTLAHLTCITADKPKIKDTLNALKKINIENILALRGDIPEGVDFPDPLQYRYASELICDIKKQGNFCIGGACYPEGHPDSPSFDADIEGVRKKVDAGCDFLITQMFFDNDILYNYMFKLLSKGINVPVIAGIMPVTNARQAKKICELSNTRLPRRFRMIVDRFGDDPACMKQAGIAYATEQIIDLIANGVKNIHIYAMNKPDIAQSIMNNLSEIFKR